MFMLHLPECRPQFPDRIALSVPPGFRPRIRQVAKRRGLTLAEFVRQALAAAINDNGPDDPPPVAGLRCAA